MGGTEIKDERERQRETTEMLFLILSVFGLVDEVVINYSVTTQNKDSFQGFPINYSISSSC